MREEIVKYHHILICSRPLSPKGVSIVFNKQILTKVSQVKIHKRDLT